MNDTADGYLVYFSGTATWTFSNGTWQQLLVPQPRQANFVMTYDVRDQYILLFGSYPYSTQTWIFEDGRWAQLTPVNSPPANQNGPTLTYDAADGYVLLLDGYGVPGTSCFTWTFAGGFWTQRCPSVSPMPRSNAAAAYDYRDQYVVVYGGYGCTSPLCGGVGALNETWIYSHGNWTQLGTPSSLPLSGGWAAYNAWDRVVVLYGTYWARSSGFSVTSWQFANGSWSRVNGTTPAVVASAMGYDGHSRMVLLLASGFYAVHPGGLGRSRMLPEMWGFRNGTWTNLSIALGPSRPTYWATLTYDWADHYVLAYGFTHTGQSALIHPTTWAYRGGSWSVLTNSSAPPWRTNPLMTFDSADGYVVLFGGGGYYTRAFNDTWTFAAGSWTHRLAAASPPARTLGAMVYDDKDGYVVLFGGVCPSYYATVYCTDMWKYHAGSWTNISSSLKGGPVARAGPTMANDTRDGYVLLFGGYNTYVGGPLNDTWEYVSGKWTMLTPSVQPPAGWGALAVFDPSVSGVLMFGAGYSARETWLYSGGNWTDLTPNLPNSPSHSPARSAPFSMSFDARDRFVVLLVGTEWIFGPTLFNLTVTASGLPSGAAWRARIVSSSQEPISMNSTTARAVIAIQNGSYTLTFVAPPGYLPEPAAVQVEAHGHSVVRSVLFEKVYAVTFTASGVPKGSGWTVDLGGTPLSSTTPSITFKVTNGSYAFLIEPIGKLTPSPSGGSAVVGGAPVTIRVKFS